MFIVPVGSQLISSSFVSLLLEHRAKRNNLSSSCILLEAQVITVKDDNYLLSKQVKPITSPAKVRVSGSNVLLSYSNKRLKCNPLPSL